MLDEPLAEGVADGEPLERHQGAAAAYVGGGIRKRDATQRACRDPGI
jgi:hypothetical protein